MNSKLVTFINKATKKHGNKYDYSKVEYIRSTQKVCIICPEHGEFWQTPAAHVRGDNCPHCANKKRGATNDKRMTTEKFILKSKDIHENKFYYEKTEYKNANTKVRINCPKHGEFMQLPYIHLNGSGCPKCSGRNLTQQEVINQAIAVHSSKYDYSKVEFTNRRSKICIICPEHGEFWQTPEKHIDRKQGCPICSGVKKHTNESFITEAAKIHNNKYDYSKVKYTNNKTNVTITCPKHGDFTQIPLNHLQGHGCPICASTASIQENTLKAFFDRFTKDTFIYNVRNIISPYEIDIYCPDKKIGFEYNGLYWHNEINQPNINYHLHKTELCCQQNIRLFHIFEDEWLNKQEIVKSMIYNVLGYTENKIYARKCIIKPVDSKTASSFLTQNHLQGKCGSTIRLGLYHNDELVSLMTFGKTRKFINKTSNDNCWELIRFCNKVNTVVIGGASKLLNHFIKMYNPIKIITYTDKRYSNGNLYEKLGFKHTHDSKPNYYYVIGNKRYYRYSYRKSELMRKYNCPPDMSEHEFCLSQKWYRIYDCGSIVFEKKLNKKTTDNRGCAF